MFMRWCVARKGFAVFLGLGTFCVLFLDTWSSGQGRLRILVWRADARTSTIESLVLEPCNVFTPPLIWSPFSKIECNMIGIRNTTTSRGPGCATRAKSVCPAVNHSTQVSGLLLLHPLMERHCQNKCSNVADDVHLFFVHKGEKRCRLMSLPFVSALSLLKLVVWPVSLWQVFISWWPKKIWEISASRELIVQRIWNAIVFSTCQKIFLVQQTQWTTAEGHFWSWNLKAKATKKCGRIKRWNKSWYFVLRQTFISQAGHAVLGNTCMFHQGSKGTLHAEFWVAFGKKLSTARMFLGVSRSDYEGL